MKKNPLQDIINKIVWNKEDAKITFLDRKSNSNIREIYGKEIIRAGTEFFFTKDGNMIPYHRIISIIVNGKTVYKR